MTWTTRIGPAPSRPRTESAVATGPADPVRRAAWTRARRAVLRANHPDVGGDAEALIRLLAEVDKTYAGSIAAPTITGSSAWRDIDISPSGRVSRLASRTARQTRRVSRAARTRIPRRWPGARRYIDI